MKENPFSVQEWLELHKAQRILKLEIHLENISSKTNKILS